MTAPHVESAEPTLAEAFGELAEGLVEQDESGAPEVEAPADIEDAPADPAAPAQPAAPETGQGKQPQAPAQPQQGREQQQQQPTADKPVDKQPLTYTVDGQQRTFDGGFVLPGLGAVISNEAMPRLMDRLQQADRLVAQNQTLYQHSQELQRLGGRGAFDKINSEKAMLDASATLLLRALSDEATLVALATDPVARQQLIKEVQLTAREAQFKATNTARESYAREHNQQQRQWQTQTAIHNAVGQLASEYSGLTEDDVAAIRTHATKMHTAIVRPATPAEAREANVQVGAPIIDLDLLNGLLADRHALRNAAAQQAQRRQTDTLENAARAAAAAPTTVVNGKTPSGTRPGAGKQTAASAQKPLDKMSNSEIKRAMQSGRIFDLIGDNDDQ